MGFNCGMPVLTLDNLPHAAGDKHGNAKKVAYEAFEERQGKDSDIDRAKTDSNIYFSFEHGEKAFRKAEELYNYWQAQADSHTCTVNGKSRKMRNDAKIGFTGIIKPDMDYINNMTHDEQMRFCKDAMSIVFDIYKKQNLTIDAAVIHVDEQACHIHYFGHDADYKMSKKVNLGLYDKLNREFPTRMRSRGWQLNDLTGYKEATANMTDDELHEYKAKKRAERREKRGVSSQEYKAGKEAKKVLETAVTRSEGILQQADREAQEIKKQAEDEAQKLKAANQAKAQAIWDAINAKSQEQDEREAAITAQEMELAQREDKLKQRARAVGRSELFNEQSSNRIRRAQPDGLDSINYD